MFDGVPIRTLFEMKQLEQALESYKIDIGAYSPETGHKQIENHIHGADIRHPKLESFDASLFGSVSTLDERELLHFWLSGAAWTTALKPTTRNFNFYEFVESRLIDSDNDGWPEYVDDQGNYFLLREGELWIHYTESDDQQSLRDMEAAHSKQTSGARNGG